MHSEVTGVQVEVRSYDAYDENDTTSQHDDGGD
jgi:hypothetical protein